MAWAGSWDTSLFLSLPRVKEVWERSKHRDSACVWGLPVRVCHVQPMCVFLWRGSMEGTGARVLGNAQNS